MSIYILKKIIIATYITGQNAEKCDFA